MEQELQTLLSVLTGLGLAAACGFRVFVPLFVVSLGAHAGMIEVAEGFEWLGSTPALIGFGTATALEIAGYYIPIVDNFLDTVATPSTIVAGSLVAGAMFTDMDPTLRWSLAVIAGGGAAAAVQTASVLTRGTSTLATAGLANPIVATGELAGATFFSGIAIVAPVVGFVLLVGLMTWYFVRRARRRNGLPQACPAELAG